MTTLLAKEGPKLSVALLLESMQQCLEFELSISRKYGISVCIKVRVYAIYIDRILLSLVRSSRNHRMPLGPLGLSRLSSRSTCQFSSMRKIGEDGLRLPLKGPNLTTAHYLICFPPTAVQSPALQWMKTLLSSWLQQSSLHPRNSSTSMPKPWISAASVQQALPCMILSKYSRNGYVFMPVGLLSVPSFYLLTSIGR